MCIACGLTLWTVVGFVAMLSYILWSMGHTSKTKLQTRGEKIFETTFAIACGPGTLLFWGIAYLFGLWAGFRRNRWLRSQECQR